ncbi:uncharacterized protein CPUR_04400 [Claviceps purpurea 20.1]|uniref:Uncharacterized protein n=1 Tax=Claviceps purpurea (strain 20.1) TaxID=1111077 RepID=M1VW29_CLAP2|nr:uncharacterized protein CPUR_04400 [Claviceps purpurea 20.1]
MGQVSLARSRKLGTKTLLSELVLRKHDLALVHDDHSEIFEFRPGPEKVKTIESKVPGKKKGKAKNDESSDHEDMGFDFEDPVTWKQRQQLILEDWSLTRCTTRQATRCTTPCFHERMTDEDGLLPGSNTPRSAEKVRVSPKLFTQSPVILDSGVAAAAVYQVYIGEFKPLNLLRLDPTRGWFVYENESTDGMDHCSGTILFKKKFFTAKDYGDTPSRFITAFSNYIVVYHRLFGVRRLDVLLAQLRFLSYVLQLSETFTWESCLEYAMRRLTAIRDNDVHDVAEWHI